MLTKLLILFAILLGINNTIQAQPYACLSMRASQCATLPGFLKYQKTGCINPKNSKCKKIFCSRCASFTNFCPIQCSKNCQDVTLSDLQSADLKKCFDSKEKVGDRHSMDMPPPKPSAKCAFLRSSMCATLKGYKKYTLENCRHKDTECRRIFCKGCKDATGKKEQLCNIYCASNGKVFR